MEVKNHKLTGNNIEPFQPTKNVSGTIPEPYPDMIILDYSRTPNRDTSIRIMTMGKRKSAHLVVGKKGKTTQLANFNQTTWHVSTSKFVDDQGNERVGLNRYSIGIAIVNAGEVIKRGNRYMTAYRRYVSDAYKHDDGSYWDKYSEAQIQAVIDACKAICDQYNIKYILTHAEINDDEEGPGPAFPIDRVREAVFGKTEEKDDEPKKEGR